jgi:hypothetical protein
VIANCQLVGKQEVIQKRASGSLAGLINDAWWLAGYSKTKKLASIGATSEKVSARTRKSCPKPQFPAGHSRRTVRFSDWQEGMQSWLTSLEWEYPTHL